MKLFYLPTPLDVAKALLNQAISEGEAWCWAYDYRAREWQLLLAMPDSDVSRKYMERAVDDIIELREEAARVAQNLGSAMDVFIAVVNG